MQVNLDDLTLGDLEAIERETGKTLGELFPGGNPTAVGMVALVWATNRASNPDYTFDDARKVKFSDFTVDDDPDPTPAAG